ncbi:MAG: hypothetical protein ACNA8P_04430 [Phycisphaerales bacterium]
MSDRKITVYISAGYALGMVAIVIALMSHFRMLPPLNAYPLRTHWIYVEDEAGNDRMQLTTLGGSGLWLTVTDDSDNIVISGGAGSGGGEMRFHSEGGGSIHIRGGSTEMAPLIDLRSGSGAGLRLTLDDQGNAILVNPVTGESKRVFDDPVEGE